MRCATRMGHRAKASHCLILAAGLQNKGSCCDRFGGSMLECNSVDTQEQIQGTGLALRHISNWCPWPESNQHSLRNSILSRARLPVPPQGHSRATGEMSRGPAKRADYSGRRSAVNPRHNVIAPDLDT